MKHEAMWYAAAVVRDTTKSGARKTVSGTKSIGTKTVSVTKSARAKATKEALATRAWGKVEKKAEKKGISREDLVAEMTLGYFGLGVNVLDTVTYTAAPVWAKRVMDEMAVCCLIADGKAPAGTQAIHHDYIDVVAV